MYEQISRNLRRSRILVACFLVIISALGYFFGAASGFGWLGFILALFIAVATSWFGYYYSDEVALSASHAKPLTKADNLYLYNLIEGLALAAGIPAPRAYLIDDTAPNAFATGRDPQHAAIAVTTGLMQKLNRAELEGVIAHEMSHIKNYDIRISTLVVVLVGMAVLLSDWMMRSLWFGRGRGRNRDGGNFQGILALVGLIFMILAPLIAQLMQLAISRKREFLADASGALLTRYPEGLASALEKLDADTEPLEVANKATAHLFIVNPLKEHGGFINHLFSTHPPIAERVKALRAM
ncbi:MAG TPA: zinc metalloprotease HtpX [Bacillota bacterium]